MTFQQKFCNFEGSGIYIYLFIFFFSGTGGLQGPRPRGGEGLRARGRAEVRAGLPGCGPGRAPHRRLLQAVGNGRPRLGARAGPGRAGLGWAARAAARPGSRAAAELTAKGGAAGT